MAGRHEPASSCSLIFRFVLRRLLAAKPLLDDIRGKIEAAQSAALPSSALSKACQYALALWKKLTRFLEYPELELSTNLAENSMRPVALGRKNLVAHRQPTGRTEGCSDSVCRGKLPSAASPGARLLLHDSPWACRSPNTVPSRPYSRCVGHPALLDSSDLGISVKSFCDQQHSFLFPDKPPANCRID